MNEKILNSSAFHVKKSFFAKKKINFYFLKTYLNKSFFELKGEIKVHRKLKNFPMIANPPTFLSIFRLCLKFEI